MSRISEAWVRATDALKPAMGMFKDAEANMKDKPAPWFSQTVQVKALQNAKDVLKAYRDAKSNCLKSITMGK